MISRHPRQPYFLQAAGRRKGHVIWPTHLRAASEEHADRAPVAKLTSEQLSWLLDGLDLKQLKPHRKLEYRTVL